MNDYQEVRFDATPCNDTITDVLAAVIADAGFESFVPDEKGLTAYVKNELYNIDTINSILENFPIEGVKFNVKSTFVEGKD